MSGCEHGDAVRQAPSVTASLSDRRAYRPALSPPTMRIFLESSLYSGGSGVRRM